jgi:hypothetical protein
MASVDNSNYSTAALSKPLAVLAQPNDLPTLATVLGSSLGQRLDASGLRDASAELGYGCVDWFIYGADVRIAPASVPLTG